MEIPFFHYVNLIVSRYDHWYEFPFDPPSPFDTPPFPDVVIGENDIRYHILGIFYIFHPVTQEKLYLPQEPRLLFSFDLTSDGATFTSSREFPGWVALPNQMLDGNGTYKGLQASAIMRYPTEIAIGKTTTTVYQFTTKDPKTFAKTFNSLFEASIQSYSEDYKPLNVGQRSKPLFT